MNVLTSVAGANGSHGEELIPFPVVDSNLLLQHLSGSSIRDYLGCSLRYYFRKVEGRAESPSLNLIVGHSVHAALQHHYLARWREQPVDGEAVVAAFEAAFASEIGEGIAGETAVSVTAKRECGVRMVKAYLDSDHCKASPAPVAVEVALRERFDGLSADMVGQVDLVLPAEDGGLIPVDFKTIANQPDTQLEGFLHETQTVLYQLLVEAATGVRVSAREIVFITKHKAPRVVVHRIPRAGDEAIARFHAMAQAAYDGILNRRWSPQPGMACSWCSFRAECATWAGEGVQS